MAKLDGTRPLESVTDLYLRLSKSDVRVPLAEVTDALREASVGGMGVRIRNHADTLTVHKLGGTQKALQVMRTVLDAVGLSERERFGVHTLGDIDRDLAWARIRRMRESAKKQR